ncbi:MAG: HupE/UreJ family protein [Rhodospirillales bacterium]|nr:HupE/UreJ family protein [Rhodospirillales bacterium]
MRRNYLVGLAAIVVLVLASPAQAHIIGAGGAGWVQGFSHPFSGLDHILAMVAVGIWAAQTGRPALWVLPVVFPLAMAGGGLLGVAGMPVPGIEAGIAASVLVLGLLIAFRVKPPLALSMALVALFALFHGHAHGTELPLAASPLLYGLGFIAATGMLHLIGLSIGHVRRLPAGIMALRVGGGGAAAGIALFIGL